MLLQIQFDFRCDLLRLKRPSLRHSWIIEPLTPTWMGTSKCPGESLLDRSFSRRNYYVLLALNLWLHAYKSCVVNARSAIGGFDILYFTHFELPAGVVRSHFLWAWMIQMSQVSFIADMATRRSRHEVYDAKLPMVYDTPHGY